MKSASELRIIKRFPEWKSKEFNVNRWNSQFVESNVIINTASSDVYFPAHWTPLSIKCAFNGPEYYITDSIKYRVDDKFFLVMNEGQMYESFINADAPVESFTICFNPRFVKNALISRAISSNEVIEMSGNCEGESAPEFKFTETLFRHNNDISKLIMKLRSSIREAGYDLMARAEILHIILDKLISLNNEFLACSARVEKTRPQTRAELFKKLNIAKDYIESCFNSHIDLSEISKAAGLSEHYMLREFKKFFGITPYQYLTGRRLEEARSLLLGTNNSVSQISLMVGFEYLSSFTKLFSRRFNMSPIKFRNNIR